jgi:hypothetical protein
MARHRISRSNNSALTWPPADPGWHPLAAELYASLPLSAQAGMYEPSDISTARVLTEALSRELTAERISGTALSTCLRGLDDLGATVGSRLRLRLDVGPASAEPPSTAKLAKYRVIAGDSSA